MRKYTLNENFFEELNEISAYWLGFLYADGYVRLKNNKSGELKLKLKNTDKKHLEVFLSDLDSNALIKCGVDKTNNSKFCFFTVNSTFMIRKLFELGCLEKKTFKIRLPKLADRLMSHFIRGYFDGDGSISRVKNRPNSFTVSVCSNKEFISDLVKYLKMGKIYEQKNYSVMKINKLTEIIEFKNFIYKDSKNKLYRKFMIFNQINENYKRDYSKTMNKKTYELTNPQGKIMITNHLRHFCDENNLVYSTMSNLSRGIGFSNKGWRCKLVKN
jgi:hypothetical protein